MAHWRSRALGMMLCLCAAAASAQSSKDAPAEPRANPTLTATANGVRDPAHARDIALRRLDVAVDVRGTIAETTITAAFSSAAREPVEGAFKLQLPAGAVVTGYALDINGKMTDGVLVDRPRAKAVYEDRVRRNVDPGLAEVTADNVFSTRVFPITPDRGRTIRVRFVSAAGTDGRIVLPLTIGAPAEGWSVAVHAIGGSTAPGLTLPGGKADFVPMADGFQAIGGGKGALDGDLVVRTVAPETLVSRHRNGDRYVQLGGTLPEGAAAERPATLRVYWDRSRSRLDDRLDAEIALLRDYLKATRPSAIELVAFNSAGATRQRVGSPDEAAAWLKTLSYRGATSFASIAGDATPADRCLLFSDGQVTIDRAADFAPQCRLDAISSAPDADRAWLSHLAGSLGGRMFALDGKQADVLAQLTAGSPGVLAVRRDDGKALPFVPIDAPAGQWRVLVKAPSIGAVRLRVGTPSDAREITRAIAGDEAAFDGEGALVARDQLAAMGATEQRADYVALSRRFGIASPSLSFVVLETPEDYVTAEVAPPASYPGELRSTYAKARRKADAAAETLRDERLEKIVGMWADEVAWWNRKFDPNARPKREKRDGGNRMESPSPIMAVPAPPPAPEPVAPPMEAADNAASADVVVTGSLQQRGRRSAPEPMTLPGAKIEIEAWQPDRPYIKAFDAAPGSFDAVFAREETKSGGIPAFYLDTAEWLRRHGRIDDAIEMVMSALDLATANEITLGIVADRLERYGAIDRAIELRERQAVLDPDRPQPKRFLALALAHRAEMRMATDRAGARADLKRAVEILRDVALTPWVSNWDGIEIIALVEANAMIPKLRKLGGSVEIDERLVALLDTDIRVVMDWTTNATDLDLWVDEPNGERSIYSNPLTAIGGQLSNDMTQGYGPEQYLLRRAPGGTFTIKSNVYAADTIDPNGASFLTVHLFRDYGRATQREEVVDVELTRENAGRGNDNERMIGRIIVPRK